MTKKSIQKLLKFLTPNSLKISRGILQRFILGILVASLFLPVLPIRVKVAEAQLSLPSIPSIRGASCNISVGTIISGLKSYRVLANKSVVGTKEKFDMYMEVVVDQATSDACKTANNGAGYSFAPFLYGENVAGTCATSLVARNGLTGYDAEFVPEKNMFRARIKNLSIENLSDTSLRTYQTNYCVYGYFFKNGTLSSSTGSIGKVNMKHDKAKSDSPEETTLPEVGASGNSQTNVKEGEVVDYQTIPISIKPKEGGAGLRSKYRVLETDGDLNFGTTAGLDAVHLEWGSKKLVPEQKFSLPKKDDGKQAGITYQPIYKNSTVYFSYYDTAKSIVPIACEAGWIGTNCSKVVFRKGDSSGNGDEAAPGQIPGDFKPILKSAAWKNKTTKTSTDKPATSSATTNTSSGKMIGQAEFVALPGIIGVTGTAGPQAYIGGGGYVNPVILVAGSGNLQKFTVEVYKDIKDIIAACEADVKPEDKEKCSKDPNFAKFGFAEPISQTTTSDEAKSETTAGSDLFNFLRKVISYLVLLMTSVLYWIFAIILVPILNALLKIRPYEDQFVNFIYPGWIILRNVANIGFILALLWMGLRTLFQVDDAGKSRGFILWLVLMALLVNFSLVIAQGVVGIADTVQSQFLPAESKVIEALGQKLMVDPIKFFRGQDSSGGFAENITENSNFTVQSSASDITKPIVLLILAIASFFSFVALIAFILVRLVALWLLYMVSPLAYVARILPETKSYFDQWWSQFIKYAFTVPILAFFLNITALMATTFASRSGDAVEAGRNPSYLFAGMDPAKEITEYAITIISHFVVLVFLYAGMHFALKSGTFGAKQIVDGAKKGFDFVTKTVPAAAGRGALAAGKWAKDTGADALASSKMLKGRPGLQKAIMGVARPIQAGKAIKKGLFDNPKEEMNKRFTEKFSDVTDKFQPWGENKLFPLKMAYWKAMGQDSKKLMTQAEQKKRFTEIRNDSDMGELATNLNTNQRYLNALNNGRADIEMARDNLSDIEGKLNAAEAEDSQNSTPGTRAKVARLRNDKNTLDVAIGIADANGLNDIDINDMGTDFNRNIDATKAKLTADISDATVVLTNDNNIRTELGFTGTMDDDVRKRYMKEASDDAEKAQYRERPFSKALAAKEDSEARDIQKNLGDLDYDQLESGFNKALQENNMAAARAHFKQMADNGVLDRLLKASGKKNNVEDLAGFVKEKFGKVSGKSQINIIREVSNSSEKNGNTSLSNAVKSLANGGGILNTITQQQQVLETKKVKEVTEWKKGDVTHTDSNGVEQFNAKIKEKLRAYDTKEKSKSLRQKIDRPIADHILSKFESNPEEVNSIGNHVASALVEVATPRVARIFKPHIVV